MNTHTIVGGHPDAFLTWQRGGLIMFSEEYDCLVTNWVVSARRAKVLLWTRRKGWRQVGDWFGTN